eukprot:Nitzschia sp. Nitz4//scaffold328_size19456//6288//7655//NITZ4_008719-RA/size19456-processed-gene-0.16-mRNA-1//-1//CDS//3329547968//4459//frame0
MTKSQAQIRRLQKRAEARGQEYTPPPPTEKPDKPVKAAPGKPDENEQRCTIAEKLLKELKEIDESSELKSKDRRSAKRKAEAIASEEAEMPVSDLLEWYEEHKITASKKNSNSVAPKDPEAAKKSAAAKKLKQAIQEIEQDEELKAKDRRSAKRKAEAIAQEESGLEAAALLEWFEAQGAKQGDSSQKGSKAPHDPYIAFVGQLSFDTTKEQLSEHIISQLKDDFKLKTKDLTIRILTDPKTKTSRGMAFVEVGNPEVLYGLLKLHQTFLNGRRINVERSAGGKKNSETRKAKLAKYREEQETYFAEVVDSILQEYRTTGELREDELDEGVVALCKRHSGPVVRASVAEYIEKGGRDMDNPSAYLSFLLTKFASEGIRDEKEKQTSTKNSGGGGGNKRKGQGKFNSNNNNNKRFRDSSEFAKAKVDMSMSESGNGGSALERVFPSARRGRGRGYM